MVTVASVAGLVALGGCSDTSPPDNPPAAAQQTAAAPLSTAAQPTIAATVPTSEFVQPSDTPAAPAATGSSFTWADPNGYRFQITVSFGTPGIADPIAGCAAGDAPPGTTNIPFTLTVTNLLPDRGSSLPMLNQALTGLTPKPNLAGADAFIVMTDGGNCGGSLYSLAGRQQNGNAVPAGSTITLQGLLYAVRTPIAGAMTFTSIYDSSTTVATIPLPAG